MTNIYGISEKDEKEIRARDKICVYCRRIMKEYSRMKGVLKDQKTIEHFNNDGPFDQKPNLAICCRSCNASRGKKELLDWFKTPYCVEKNINEETVAEPVKKYLRTICKSC